MELWVGLEMEFNIIDDRLTRNMFYWINFCIFFLLDLGVRIAQLLFGSSTFHYLERTFYAFVRRNPKCAIAKINSPNFGTGYHYLYWWMRCGDNYIMCFAN